MNVLDAVKTRRLIIDGAMGTMLQHTPGGRDVPPELWNIDDPARIEQVHFEYLEAGADILTTNTFGVNPDKYPNWQDLARGAMEACRRALERYKAAHPEDNAGKYIAWDIGPTGKLCKPAGNMEFEDAVSIFAASAKLGAELGADLILIETMTDISETRAAVIAAKESCNLPVFVSNCYDSKGKLLTGGTAQSVIATLEGLRADVIGVNCGQGPEDMLDRIREYVKYSSLPVFASPNAGLPKEIDGETVYDLSPEEFAACMTEAAKAGLTIPGGCCGTTPAHIAALKRALGNIPLEIPGNKNISVISSASGAAIIGDFPLLIGERINPTGKPKFREALRANRLEYAVEEGIKQTDAGAHILDVNVGLPDIDETAVLRELTQQLSGVTSLPLQLDSSSPESLAAAMRVYPGKALINSVNGSRKSMDAILPLLQKYGGVAVCLTLDEQGIPETAEARVAIAEKIAKEAEKYGISKKDLVIDPLCMAVSADAKGALTTLNALTMLKARGFHTVLGVSNISFGLPSRPLINASFLNSALERGLDLAIINPFSREIMTVFRAFQALHMQDEGCERYIEFAKSLPAANPVPAAGTGSAQGQASATNPVPAAGTASANPPASSGTQPASDSSAQSRLTGAIFMGLANDSASEASSLLSAGTDPQDVINKHIIPALDAAGTDFGAGRIFLPRLLKAADAANSAFAVVRTHMKAHSDGAPTHCKVILATVEGDIHDIGKNIVKLMLESYGFQVLDLGRDVPAEKVVEAVRAENVKLVGLSALMTTTVRSMERTIQLLHAECPGVKTMVGGAVLTPDYANKIGADFYSRDAMEAVNVAMQAEKMLYN